MKTLFCSHLTCCWVNKTVNAPVGDFNVKYLNPRADREAFKDTNTYIYGEKRTFANRSKVSLKYYLTGLFSLEDAYYCKDPLSLSLSRAGHKTWNLREGSAADGAKNARQRSFGVVFRVSEFYCPDAELVKPSYLPELRLPHPGADSPADGSPSLRRWARRHHVTLARSHVTATGRVGR